MKNRFICGFIITLSISIISPAAWAQVFHGCSIEDRVPIGMGAMLLNDVHVEHDCVIAAGTLLTEGTRVPSGSLVMGRPGKVKRALTADEIAEIRWYADNYVKYRLDYK